MGKIELEIFEDKLQSKSARNCNLSVLFGADRLSYLVCDESMQIKAFKTYRLAPEPQRFSQAYQQIPEILQMDRLLQNSFAVVQVGVVNEEATLVPEQLFNEKEQSAYFVNLIPIADKDLILNNKLHSPACRQMFKIPSGFYEMIRNNFPAARFFHVFTCLIKGCLQLNETDPTKRIFVHVRKQRMDVFVVKDRMLLFANSYAFSDAKDFIYYILMVYKQFDLNPNVQQLMISGHLRQESEIYKLLYRYIRYLEFVKYPPQLRFGKSFKATAAEHTFFDLYQLALCE